MSTKKIKDNSISIPRDVRSLVISRIMRLHKNANQKDVTICDSVEVNGNYFVDVCIADNHYYFVLTREYSNEQKKVAYVIEKFSNGPSGYNIKQEFLDKYGSQPWKSSKAIIREAEETKYFDELLKHMQKTGHITLINKVLGIILGVHIDLQNRTIQYENESFKLVPKTIGYTHNNDYYTITLPLQPEVVIDLEFESDALRLFKVYKVTSNDTSYSIKMEKCNNGEMNLELYYGYEHVIISKDLFDCSIRLMSNQNLIIRYSFGYNSNGSIEYPENLESLDLIANKDVVYLLNKIYELTKLLRETGLFKGNSAPLNHNYAIAMGFIVDEFLRSSQLKRAVSKIMSSLLPNETCKELEGEDILKNILSYFDKDFAASIERKLLNNTHYQRLRGLFDESTHVLVTTSNEGPATSALVKNAKKSGNLEQVFGLNLSKKFLKVTANSGLLFHYLKERDPDTDDNTYISFIVDSSGQRIECRYSDKNGNDKKSIILMKDYFAINNTSINNSLTEDDIKDIIKAIFNSKEFYRLMGSIAKDYSLVGSGSDAFSAFLAPLDKKIVNNYLPSIDDFIEELNTNMSVNESMRDIYIFILKLIKEKTFKTFKDIVVSFQCAADIDLRVDSTPNNPNDVTISSTRKNGNKTTTCSLRTTNDWKTSLVVENVIPYSGQLGTNSYGHSFGIYYSKFDPPEECKLIISMPIKNFTPNGKINHATVTIEFKYGKGKYYYSDGIHGRVINDNNISYLLYQSPGFRKIIALTLNELGLNESESKAALLNKMLFFFPVHIRELFEPLLYDTISPIEKDKITSFFPENNGQLEIEPQSITYTYKNIYFHVGIGLKELYLEFNIRQNQSASWGPLSSDSCMVHINETDRTMKIKLFNTFVICLENQKIREGILPGKKHKDIPEGEQRELADAHRIFFEQFDNFLNEGESKALIQSYLMSQEFYNLIYLIVKRLFEMSGSDTMRVEEFLNELSHYSNLLEGLKRKIDGPNHTLLPITEPT